MRTFAGAAPLAPKAAAVRAQPEAVEDLFRRYAPYVATIALRLLGRHDEVDDVVQDVFLAAVRGLRRLREPAAARAWLATVTVRVARRRLLSRRMRALLGIDAYDYEDVAAHGATPEQQSLLAGVYRALDRLPPNQRIAWSLRVVDGESLERVAVLCDCSLATAKRRIAAARARVEKVLSDD